MNDRLTARSIFTKAIDKLPPDANDYFLWINMGDVDMRSVGHFDAQRNAFKDELLGLYFDIKNIEWLDESNTQQLFTREQVKAAYDEGFYQASNGQNKDDSEEYMNIKYPL